MKKSIRFLGLSLLICFVFSSCLQNISIDLSNIPSSLLNKTTYINSSGGLGTVYFSTERIIVTRGSTLDENLIIGDLEIYNNSAQYDTNTLKANGYSITTSFTQGDINDPFDLGTLDLICTKKDSPTLIYCFGICPNDIAVSKKVNGVEDLEYNSMLGYTNLD